MSEDDLHIVAVSNRLPVVLARVGDSWESQPGAGGLVTALAPVLKNRGGRWIGWLGTTEQEDFQPLLKRASHNAGYELHSVGLTEEDVRGFYYGFANEILWPLFHGFETKCNFVPEYWQRYLDVNCKFARAVILYSRGCDYIWVHDYHLMHTAYAMRTMGAGHKIGFFLHIPFPPIGTFLKLPWRVQILQALLSYDLVGFQTMRDRRNFIECIQHFRLPGLKVRGRGAVVTVTFGERAVRVGSFPISIDFRSFAESAASEGVSDRGWYLHEALPEMKIVLGIDRLDYTKGILERLEAVRKLFSRFPEMRGKFRLVQVVVPSREDVPGYQILKAQIERLVSQVNGEFSYPGWVPVHYLYRSLQREELIAYYRTAEIGLVTPLRDGMNLVAKEYCACNVEHNGVLILSEFAGAAAELQKGALLVNPYDVEGVADAIMQALQMSPEERSSRMRKMRELVRRHDIYKWVDSILQAAMQKRLEDFPPVEEYVPGFGIEEDPGHV